MQEIFEECFDTKSIYFSKMLDIFNQEQLPPFNKHHIIPRSYFKKKKEKIVNKDNIITLSITNHLIVHYYMWKCAKPFIKKEMAAATKWIFVRNINDENIIFEASDYAKIKAEVEKLGKFYNQKTSKKILCLETNIIYDTLHECAKAEKCEYRLLSKVINNKRLSVNNKHFIIAKKEKYSSTECAENIKFIEQKRIKNTGRKYKVKCLEIDKIFDNGRQAALFLGLEYRNVNYALNHSGRTQGYTFSKLTI